MEALEVNMYVRVNNDIRTICIGIGKIKQINQETVYVDMGGNLPISFNENQISKASHNIIDLIEVGDYVNGFRVDEVEYSKSTIYIGNTKKVIEQALWSNDIKSIVTKEQFENSQYKVSE